MIYLLLGDDSQAKDQKFIGIKKQYLPSPETRNFDYEIFYAPKFDALDLKKALWSLPVLASQRLVVVRTIQKLSKSHKDIILEFKQLPRPSVVLVLDSDVSDANNSFLREIKTIARTLTFSKGKKVNVFDMTRAMSSARSSDALRMLSEIFLNGDHPLQVVGGLLWFWGRCQARLSPRNFQQGLIALKEADLNIKRSRLPGEYAIEILVVKLMGLLRGTR